ASCDGLKRSELGLRYTRRLWFFVTGTHQHASEFRAKIDLRILLPDDRRICGIHFLCFEYAQMSLQRYERNRRTKSVSEPGAVSSRCQDDIVGRNDFTVFEF